jgi:hypothetical protein
MSFVDIECAYCGTADGPFHRDHVVPRSRGGPDTPSNLVMACAPCNLHKSASLPSEWMGDGVPSLVAKIEERISSSVAKSFAKRGIQRRRRSAPIESDAICYFCGAPLVSMDDAFLELFDQEVGLPYLSQAHIRFKANGGQELRGALAYPGNGLSLVSDGSWSRSQSIVVFSHAECGPDIGYAIGLHQLAYVGAAVDWSRHLGEKTRFPQVFDDLAHAESVATRMFVDAERRKRGLKR